MTTVLDINQFVYQTGTLTIAPGDTTALFTGAAIASGPARDGDWLFAGGTISVLKTIVDDGEAELFVPWGGDAVTAGPYVILKASLLRYQPALAAVDSGELIAMINQRQIFYNVPGAVPDPSIGKEGDFAIKTNSGAWLLWKFLSGAWELQATPVGANWRGLWDSGTEYVVNDTVRRNGSTYISLSINTNAQPESSEDDWDLSAEKGDPGRDGGVIAIPYTFDGSATGNTDPGAGKLRLGPGASQFAAVVWRVNPVDSAGLDWTGTITDLAAGTSSVKCAARLYRVADQTKRIVANVTAINTMAGYFNFVVVPTSGDANPFTNGEDFVLVLDRNGDKGDMPVMFASSTSSVEVGTGPKNFTVAADLSIVAGQRMRAVNADASKAMIGPVASYSGTSLSLNVDQVVGAGTDNAWTISITGERGATPVITGTSASSVAVGLGAKSFTVQTGLAIVASQRLRIANADSSRVMIGTVTSYNIGTGALVMAIDDIVGSGTDNAWIVSIAGEKGIAPVFAGTSTSSVAVGTGAKTFTTQTGLAFTAAQRLRIANDDSSRVMVGTVTSYTSSTGALVMNIDEITGSGTEADWNISVSGQKGAKGDKGLQWKGMYNPATAYVLDDLAYYAGKLYVNIQAGTGSQPDTSPAFWDLFFDPNAPLDSVVTVPLATNYTATQADRSKLLKFTVGATLSLTAAATLGNGWFSYFKVTGGALVIDPDSSEQVDGATTITIPAGGSGLLICDGAGFTTFLIGGGGGSLSSMIENVKTNDYTVVAADQGRMLTANKATAIAFTLLSTASAGAAFNAFYKNIGVGTLTIAGTENIEVNGLNVASLSLEQGEQAALFVAEGGTIWRALVWRSEGHVEPETDVATAATMDIGATNTERVRATGTTQVTSFGTRRNKKRSVRWTGTTQVIHDPTTLILPGGLPIAAKANDIWQLESDASGNWRLVRIFRAASPGRETLGINTTLYVRADLGAATVTLATPGVWTLNSHGLQNDDPIVFYIKPDLGTCTMTIATPGVVTRNAHGYTAGQPIKFTTTNAALPTGVTANTTYYVIATGLTTNTFQFSATVGGAAVATSGTQSGTHYVEKTGALPTGVVAGTVYYARSVALNTFQFAATAGGASIATSGSQSGIFNVATGNDANNGSAANRANALLTVQKAGTIAAAWDLSTFNVNIFMADSLYIANPIIQVVGPWVGSGDVLLEGNPTIPSNTIVQNALGWGCFVTAGGRLHVRNFKVTCPGGLSGMGAQFFGQIKNRGGIDFGDCAFAHWDARDKGLIYGDYGTGAYTISGGCAAAHFYCSNNGSLSIRAISVVIRNTPGFGVGFVNCDTGSSALLDSFSKTGTTIGSRYSVQSNSIVQTFGGQATTSTDFFPGSGNGSTQTQGLML